MESKDLLSRISEVHPNQVWLDKEKVEKRYVYLFFKRMIDIVGSIIGLILASPLMIYVAYRIRKEEPKSPIIFSHTRVGKNGKT
ncbi:sugar transferase, partial [Enterococcus lactis]